MVLSVHALCMCWYWTWTHRMLPEYHLSNSTSVVMQYRFLWWHITIQLADSSFPQLWLDRQTSKHDSCDHLVSTVTNAIHRQIA